MRSGTAFTAVALAACGGGASVPATPATVAPPASTTCVAPGFSPEESRGEDGRVVLCDAERCVAVDVANGAWSDAPFETTPDNAPWSRVDGVLQFCDEQDRCTAVPAIDGTVDVRSAAYDAARGLVAVTTRDGSLIVVSLDGTRSSVTPGITGIVEWAGPTLRVEGELYTVDPVARLATIGGDEPWTTILTQAHAEGSVWAFGDGVGTVVLQDVVTGAVRERIELPMNGLIGPARLGDDLYVVDGGEVILLSAAGRVGDRFRPPICATDT